jgi:hypothetical protein
MRAVAGADRGRVSNNMQMQSAFPFVVFGAVAFSLVMSLVFLITNRTSAGGSVYDQIGEGGLLRGEGASGNGPPMPVPDSPAAGTEREREIRQMLGARSERLVARGRPALDIDAEVARLMQPPQRADAHEAGLVDEVRQLVIARNERRLRQGLQALDVEAEMARTLRELDQ